ncbi:MAG: aminotransferase class III-fold pyridoxal phosphate-dependent enzyme, partial [Lentisphaerae bacterium]|nr:aminotransferase class III-fold pyridoxal phosphate-dependent enzyme [Lentisphaerota bacterium]
HAGIIPDFVCLSKGLTAGWGAMSAVLCSNKIYNAFYGDYVKGNSFLHSNTYCGNAIAAAAALEAMKIYEDEKIAANVAKRSCELRMRMEWVASETGALKNVRGIGFIAAADIINPDTGKSFPAARRTGFNFYRNAVELGALLRPLGDTVYFLPPLNTPDKVLDDLAEIAVKALRKTLK